jgi:hypothetical protein
VPNLSNSLKKELKPKSLLMLKPLKPGHQLSKELRTHGEHLLTTSMTDLPPLFLKKMFKELTLKPHGKLVPTSTKLLSVISLNSLTTPRPQEKIGVMTLRLTFKTRKRSTNNTRLLSIMR